MTSSEFLVKFKDILQRDDDVTLDMPLADMDEWDSMSIMAVMAWFDLNLGVKLSYKAIEEQKTVRDIIALGNGKIA